jgi:ssDNA thymidine ADP-ribosyltransferase DarT-like protein
MIDIDNLETDLTNGLYSKMNAPVDPNRKVIGNAEVISERDKRVVHCYAGTVVNNYVPFYFSVRTPMLFNIYSGYGVKKVHQSKIVYLCVPLLDVAIDNFQWCFTDGNAAKRITTYFTSLDGIDSIDWHSITSTDFKHDNADGDEDRIRKKHSEFLVKDFVPSNLIKGIVVYNEQAKTKVKSITQKLGLEIEPRIVGGFYF